MNYVELDSGRLESARTSEDYGFLTQEPWRLWEPPALYWFASKGKQTPKKCTRPRLAFVARLIPAFLGVFNGKPQEQPLIQLVRHSSAGLSHGLESVGSLLFCNFKPTPNRAPNLKTRHIHTHQLLVPAFVFGQAARVPA